MKKKKEILQYLRLRDKKLYLNILRCAKGAGLNGINEYKTIA